MTASLKPFVINLGDIQFLLTQTSLLPLFDASGALVFGWAGDSAIYATSQGAAGGAALYDPATSTLTSEQAMAQFGTSFFSVADAGGVRDVSGLSNNLNPLNAYWGMADVPFLNVGSAGDLGYGHYLLGDPNNPLYSGTGAPDYTITGSGTAVNIASVVDYTPRMITQTVMTGGVRLLLDGNQHIVYWDPQSYNTDNTYKALIDGAGIDTSKLVIGAAVVNTYQDVLGYYNAGLYAYGKLMQAYGIDMAGEFAIIDLPGLDAQIPFVQAAFDQASLIDGLHIDVSLLQTGDALIETATSPYGILGDLGVPDYQNPNNGEYFLEAQNAGVAPSNGFFAVFGQFFDHGLDFIGKGASGTKITIPLSPDDPLYGVIGQDGRPTTTITIMRANVAEVDENGAPLYVNHTSPFIDQSQTYGSQAQVTAILREWVEDPNNPGSYIAGARLLDGNKLVAWTNGFGVETNSTLPTLNELRAHVASTGRSELTWEDVLNLRQRDAAGQLLDTDAATAGVQTGNSGHALLLDMNPHVDGAHLIAALGASDADGVITTLSAAAASLGMSFGLTPEGVIYLDIPSQGLHLTGVSALYPWLNFGDFTIAGQFGPMTEAVHAAVGQVMMASVGDHYLAGDGRVNENVALTSIHHIFHMEHEYQAQNLEIALFQQDSADHAVLQSWQTAVTVGTASNSHIGMVAGHWEALDGILARDEKGDFYVVAAGTQASDLAVGHSLVLGRDGAVVDATGSYTDAAGFVSWDQERLFQGVKLIVEMEYQHTAVDQYARAITPDIPEFSGYSSDIDATITMAYAQGAFRFGHSTLRETIDTLDPNGDMTGRIMSYALEKAFLNPALYEQVGAASLVMGMTRQAMNDIDEFITPALQQGLLGLPMDLAAINIARGRDVGLPTLNQAREMLSLGAYTSWTSFEQNMYHKESLVNFIAAYSFDGDVAAAQSVLDGAHAGNLADLQFLNGGDKGFAKIDLWIGGLAESHVSGGQLGETFNVVFVDQIQRLMDGDRFYYLYRLAGVQFGDEIINEQFKDIVERNTGTSHLNGNIFGYADNYYETSDNAVATERLYTDAGAGAIVAPVVTVGAHVDPNGGPYYDANGIAYIALPKDLAGNATANLYGSATGDHANAPAVAVGEMLSSGVVYYTASGAVADLVALAAAQHKYGTILADHPGIGVYTNGGSSTAGNGGIITIDGRDYVLDIRPNLLPDAFNTDGTPVSGSDSNEVLAGTDQDDLIYLGFSDDTGYGDGGNDTIYGGSGGDRIYGGDGNDVLYGDDLPDVLDGGDGDDILYGGDSGSSVGGFDQLIGGAGDDTIYGGVGIDKIFGNSGDDALYGEADTDPFMFGGDGSDIVSGGDGQDNIYGNTGDDLLIGGNDKDILFGQEGDDILRPGIPSGAANPAGGNTGNAVFGPDEVVGGMGNVNNVDTGFDVLDLSDNSMAYQLEINLNAQNNPLTTIDQNQVLPTMIEMDGIIGTQAGDKILGNLDGNWLIGGGGNDAFEVNVGARNNGAQAEVLADRGGNDVIVGGSIRLDALIGRYGTGDLQNFVADTYSTAYALIGANHRVAESATLIGGLLNGTATAGLFALHFTEMLRSAQFRDLMLGDGLADSDTDMVQLSGNFSDYSAIAVDANGNQVTDIAGNYASVVGVRITDNGSATRVATDGTDLVVGVEQFVFADGSHTLREVIGSPPTLALNYAGGPTSFADNFSNTVANGSDGSIPWTTSWVEAADGTNSVNNGQIQIDNPLSGQPNNPQNTLVVGVGDGASITRELNLANVQTATLSFSFEEFGLATTETVSVLFSASGNAADFITVGTITGDGGGTQNGVSDTNTTRGNVSVVLTGPFSSAALIQIVASTIENTGNSRADYVAIDNLKVDYVTPVTNIETNIARSFVEHGANVAIAPRPLIADLDGTTLTSARVVLTNAKDGDNLVWSNGTSGNGFSVSRDTSVAGQITLLLTSTAPQSFAAFADRLDNIQFTNTSGNPDTTARVIQTTVNDGRLDSAPATTTISVTAINDPAVAVGDNVVSNATSFAIPTAALLANDYDPEGDAFAITGTSGASGVSAALAGAVINITNTNGNNDRFNYQITGGASAQVNVNFSTQDTLSGSTGRDIIIGNGAASTIDGGAGDDLIYAGAGNDVIMWYSNAGGTTDGHDFVDGGDGSDTFTIEGNASAENFRILTTAAALLEGFVPTNAATEIFVIRNGVVVAELDNVEELIINTLDVTANNGNGVLDTGLIKGDTVTVAGDFTTTSLAYSTIHVNGSAAHDIVDITGLTSAHRVVFDTHGGGDEVIGALRPQDQIIDTSTAPQPAPTVPDVEDDLDHITPPPMVLTSASGGETMVSAGGDDAIFGGSDADNILAGAGRDMIFAGAGADRVIAGDGDDFIHAGAGADIVFGGAGDDTFVAEVGDGNDIYYGDGFNDGAGTDTLDMSQMTVSVTVDLGTDGNARGSAYSAQTGHDTLWNFENVITGSGDDVITANNAVNIIDGGDGHDIFRFTSAQAADGDLLQSFQPGDIIDLSTMDADATAAGNQAFTLTSAALTGPGQVMVSHATHDGDTFTVVEGNVTGGAEADFKFEIRGTHNLTAQDFNL